MGSHGGLGVFYVVDSWVEGLEIVGLLFSKDTKGCCDGGSLGFDRVLRLTRVVVL